jgi:hypothetical protein
MKRWFPFLIPTSAFEKRRWAVRSFFLPAAALGLLWGAETQAATPAELLAEVRATDAHRDHLVFKARPSITDSQYLEALGGTPVSGIFIEEGKKEGQGWGITVFDHPVERVWAAIIHEEAMDGKFSLGISTIIEGQAFRSGRLIFQTLELPRPLSDRYWVTRATHGSEAFAESGGALWEVSWQDVNKEFSLSGTPYAQYEENSTPVEWTLGAWLLVPLSNGKTLVEYVVSSSPGGRIPPALAARFAPGQVLQTLDGMEKFVTEHRKKPVPAGVQRPDGSGY